MIFDDIKKFIFPSRCVICDSVLPFGHTLASEYLCDECKKKLEYIKKPTCKKCGAMISDENDKYCLRCKSNMHENFIAGFSLLRYNDFVKESLHKIKYDSRKEYLYFYGKMIAKVYKERFRNLNLDAFVPVPIHKKRLLVRNFNQATVLAETLSNELKKYDIDIPVDENIIFRKKDTKVLNKLDTSERNSELDDAFSINEVVDRDTVMIVDDIYTTGATINKVAYMLRRAGVKSVYFVTISIVDNL